MLPFFRKKLPRQSRQIRRARRLLIERLEDRTVLSAFSVTNLNDHGAGSLRQAILNANSTVGADVIDFAVTGVIKLTSGALPAVTDSVRIDGANEPSFAGTPVVEVDYNGFGGLQFKAGAAGSTLRSLALVHSSGAGVKLNGGGHVLIAGNYIGLALDGHTVAANRGNGVELDSSVSNTIGGTLAADRNVIAGNRLNGIYVDAGSGNLILGNYIGADATGALDRGNAANGIVITDGSMSNVIGGAAGNVISGNDASGIDIKSKATLNTVSANIIGLSAAGTAALGNGQDGVKIENANNNLVGHSDPITSITYANANNVNTQPVSAWQGIRAGDVAGQYLISGTSNDNGLLFDGTIDGNGHSYLVDFPGAQTTSVYGPDNLGGGTVRLVGSYKNADFATASVVVNGFVFEGTVADLSESSDYQTIDYPGAEFNYVHSTMGGLAVGNYDSAAEHGDFGLPLGPGHAYIYDISQAKFLTDIVYPGSKSNTAYGIWYNGGTSYTICGGYSLDPTNNFADQSTPIGKAYLVDYDSATGKFSNWTSFDYPFGTNYETHFEGISSVEKGVYTLNADSLQTGTGRPAQGSWVTVRRNTDGSFGPATWVNLNYTGVDPSTNITSSNSVYGNQVVGVVIGPGGTFSYQATVNTGFQLSNVISANGGNGIELLKANGNQVAMNYIGAGINGTRDFGNTANGILITSGSSHNLIGGEATGGNDPTNNVFVRPPQGNLISGNNGDGVLINGKATANQLSGNFIGTDATGNAALGNSLDGVAIVNANGNSLIGCTFQQNPFVFYNVISGNAGNGLRVDDSNDTTIQANFFGMGANNNTALGNAVNGVLVEGSSTRTVMGGPIPLGNVDAANGQNGIVVQDKASFFTTYNTFCGLAAFSDDPHFGNGADGMLITSTGGNILIRTNVITENGDDGIDIAGNARDVRVAGNIIGLNTKGLVPMGNSGNGVEVGGNAHDVVIGGPQPTFNVIPQNAISANGASGVAIVGTAHNVTVSNSYIGTDITGLAQRGNSDDGVSIGPGSYSNTVGSADPKLITVISGNSDNGIAMTGTTGNTVINSYIGTDASGLLPLGNGANGIYLSGSSKNTIGHTSSGGLPNIIAFNTANGVFVESGNRNGISQNSIYDNSLGIQLGAGANNNQAAPVLLSVTTRPQEIQVYGTLTSTPKTTFTLEFFASDADDGSGRIYLGSLTVKTDSNGYAAFTFFGDAPPAAASFITATATDPNNNTSEFSAAIS
jgi:trimeric autotransporter adhesin